MRFVLARAYGKIVADRPDDDSGHEFRLHACFEMVAIFTITISIFNLNVSKLRFPIKKKKLFLRRIHKLNISSTGWR